MRNRYKADEFAVAVLEKVAKLEDEEEVAGLVEVAQGRRAFHFRLSVHDRWHFANSLTSSQTMRTF